MIRRLVRLFSWPLALVSALAQGADLHKLVEELANCPPAEISNTLVPGTAFEFRTETRSRESDDVISHELIVTHFRSEHQWRVDSDATFFDGYCHYCRDHDFWFVATGDAEAYHYDRLGFSSDTASSIEASFRTRLAPLFASSHILDFTLREFAVLAGNRFSAVLDMQNKQSECAMAWDLTPAKESEIIEAHGSLEWWRSPRGPRVTYLKYAFGTRDSSGETASRGIELVLNYDKLSQTGYPISVVSRQPKSISTTTFKKTFSAVSGDAYYSPAAFGLERPRAPLPTWIYLLLAGIAFGISSFAVRRFRNA